MMETGLKKIGIIFIIVSLIFAGFILSFFLLNFTNYSGDQINDAYRVMGIWEGKWPTLGPGPAAWSELIGDVYLPPLYYYLVFPSTLFTNDLSAQGITNALFTFLSIPLLSLTVYKLLEGVGREKRFFLAALSGLWYSLLFRNIVLSTGDSLAGNPVSIPFFLLCLVLLYDYQLKSNLSPAVEILCWITYGLILAIITNLHFSALYVMPVVFIISIIYYIAKKPTQIKRWLLPGLSIVTCLLALTPYWIGELGRNWQNTQRIIALVFDSSTDAERSVSLWQRLNAIIQGYLDLGQGVYFFGNTEKSWLISVVFLTLVLIVGIYKFRGNKIIFGFLLITWVIFLLAYSSTDMEKTYNPVFYKILIYQAPIILTMCSLAYLNVSSLLEKLLIGFIIACLTISLLLNIRYHITYITSRGGMPRVPNTRDISYALQQIPAGSTVCHYRQRYNNIRNQEYINQYVNQGNLKFMANCQPNSYLLYPKYESLGDYRLHETAPLSQAFENFNYDYELFEDLPLFYIYKVKS